MKFLSALMFAAVTLSCHSEENVVSHEKEDVIKENFIFCEGSIPFNSGVLVSNFGSQELDPLNTEGKGYISKLIGSRSNVFIPADGYMNAPKGMAISKEYLFVADVGKVLVYNINEIGKKPIVLTMPSDNIFVNDIVINNEIAYISVTNTGKIFKLDVSSPAIVNEAMLQEYMDIPGANGLVVYGNSLFIASYPPDGNTTENNVIYKISDLNNPVLEKYTKLQGQYDGLAVYKDKLYFSNWIDGEIGYVDMKTKQLHQLNLTTALSGPADISIIDGVLYIPDLPQSQVVKIKL